MASARRKAQQRVRPRYAPDLALAGQEIKGAERAFAREKGSIRGAGRAVSSSLDAAIDAARQSGLEGRYLRQYVNELRGRAGDVSVGVKDEIAGARVEHRDTMSGLSDALNSLRNQRRDAVLTETEQIRKARKSRRQERRDKRRDAQGELREAERDFRRAVRSARGEIPAMLREGAEAVGPASPTALALSRLLGPEAGINIAIGETRNRLLADEKAREDFIDDLAKRENVKNRRVAGQALINYLSRKEPMGYPPVLSILDELLD